MSYLDDLDYKPRRPTAGRWLSGNNDRLKGISGKFRSALKQRDTYRLALRDAESDNRALGGNLEKLHTRNAVIGLDLEDSKNKALLLADERDTYRRANDRVNRKLLSLEEEAEDARGLLAKIKVSYSSKLADAEDKIDRLDDGYRSAQAANRLLRGDKVELEDSVLRLRVDKRSQGDRLRKQREDLAVNSLLIKDLRKQVGIKSVAVETLSDDLKLKGDENRILRGKNLELQDARDADAAEIRLLLKKLGSLEDERLVLKEDCRSLRGKLYDLSQNDRRLRGLLAEYEEELDVMEIAGYGGKKTRGGGRKKSSSDGFDWEPKKRTPGGSGRGSKW